MKLFQMGLCSVDSVTVNTGKPFIGLLRYNKNNQMPKIKYVFVLENMIDILFSKSDFALFNLLSIKYTNTLNFYLPELNPIVYLQAFN